LDGSKFLQSFYFSRLRSKTLTLPPSLYKDHIAGLWGVIEAFSLLFCRVSFMFLSLNSS
jgi:hypothetical protein